MHVGYHAIGTLIHALPYVHYKQFSDFLQADRLAYCSVYKRKAKLFDVLHKRTFWEVLGLRVYYSTKLFFDYALNKLYCFTRFEIVLISGTGYPNCGI